MKINQYKEKSYAIIQIDADDNTQHPFLINTLGKPGKEKNFLSLIMGAFKKKKTANNIILNDERLSTFPLRSRTSQGWLLSLLECNTTLKNTAGATKLEKNINAYRLKVWK